MAGRHASVAMMLLDVQIGQEPEPEPEQEPAPGAKKKALKGRMRRASVAIRRRGEEEGPSYQVSAEDDKNNLAALMGGSGSAANTPQGPAKKKVGRMRRMSVEVLKKAVAVNAQAMGPPRSRSGASASSEDAFDAPGAAHTGSAGTNRVSCAGTSRSSGSGDSPGDAAMTPGGTAKPKKAKGFRGRMRRMSVEMVTKVATAVAGEELLEEVAAEEEQLDQQQELAAQCLAEQNDRRMRAEMRRKKEEEDQAQKAARAAIVQAERDALMEKTNKAIAKERDEQDQIKREVERQRREKEQKDLTMKSMGKATATREAALDLYMQAMESGQAGARPGSGASSSSGGAISGHWTVEAPAAVTCEMSDALDEVKLMAHRISPVKYGGVTRDRLVIIAIGGATGSGKSWLGMRLADSALNNGLEAMMLSLDTFTKLATGAVQSPTSALLHPFLDAWSLLGGSGSLDSPATYDLAFARKCLKQLRSDLVCELPARAVSDMEQGEGGEGMTTARVPPSKVVVIEGRFALHPLLADVVDVRVHCGGNPHPMLMRQIARQADRDAMAEEAAALGISTAMVAMSVGGAASWSLSQMASSALPSAALYTSRIGSFAELLVRNDWSPLGSSEEDVTAMGGQMIYGVTVNRGKTNCDFKRISEWVYGMARTSSGRCISCDAATHLMDYEWLVKPSAGTAKPRRRVSTAGSTVTIAAQQQQQQRPKTTESMARPSMGGSRGTHFGAINARGSSAGSNTSAATAAATATATGPMSAKAEERAKQRSHKRSDPSARPWRTAAQPKIKDREWSDESDEESAMSGTTGATKKKPMPPWPEDGILPPTATVVEAVGLPPRDALDPTGVGSRIGPDKLPRYWVRITDRQGQFRVVVCERPLPGGAKDQVTGGGDAEAEADTREEQAVGADGTGSGDEQDSGDNEENGGDKNRKGRSSSRNSTHRKHRHHRKGKGERSSSSRSNRNKKKTADDEHDQKENAATATAPADDNDKLSTHDEQEEEDGEDPAPSRRFKHLKNTVPSGVAAWGELALGGEAEGGAMISQLLAVGYRIDTVHSVQSHSFLVPVFARPQQAANGPDLGPDTPVHAAGGSVLVVVERRTLLGGAHGEGMPHDDDEDDKDGPAVTVRVEGVDAQEVERVGRLITLGTLAARKLRGVDRDNMSALAGFAEVSNRPGTGGSANLPWLNPWRDNSTPSNSRPASGASTRSRPGSGSSGRSGNGGGYGAGGLVALPTNRSQKRVKSREGLSPGGKHGEYWGKDKPPARKTRPALADVNTTRTRTRDSRSLSASSVELGLAGMAAAKQNAAAEFGEISSSEEDVFDC